MEITGFDKEKDMFALLGNTKCLRPDISEGLVGSGVKVLDIQTQEGIEKLSGYKSNGGNMECQMLKIHLIGQSKIGLQIFMKKI